jgi:hypothetical protein
VKTGTEGGIPLVHHRGVEMDALHSGGYRTLSYSIRKRSAIAI